MSIGRALADTMAATLVGQKAGLIMRSRTGLVLIAAIMIVGCSTVITQLEPQLVSERLPFIRDGKTSKEEVISRLGVPDNRYEEGRIFTYEMCGDVSLESNLHRRNSPPPDVKGEAVPGAFYCSPERTHTLVFVFGSDELVTRHSLVVLAE